MATTPERARRSRAIALVAAAGLCIAALAWLRWGVEWVERTIDVGYGTEARRNPHLAAERFLRGRGIDTETVSGLGLLDRLPPPDEVVLLSSSRRTVSERRLEALEVWVRAGGHLFVVATEPWDEDAERSRDPLLDALGVRLWPVEDEHAEEEPDAIPEDATAPPGDGEAERGRDDAPATPPTPIAEGDPAPVPRRVGELLAMPRGQDTCSDDPEALARAWYGDSDTLLELALDDTAHLETVDGAEFSFGNARATQLVHLRVGDGEVTVVTSLRAWRNAYVACHDHALVLWLLVRGHPKVWLLHDPAVPGIAALVADALPLTCLAATLALLVWGTSQSLRFGLRPPALERPRRSWMEHLEAAAGVAWRADHLASALEDVRRALAAEHVPGRASTHEDPRSAHAGTSVEIESALHGPLPRRRSELVHMVRTLRHISHAR